MSSIDNRVVQMNFNNQQFESNATQSLGTISKLKSALDFSKSKSGVSDISNSVNKLDLSGITSGVSTIASKFTSLGIVGVTALTNIANRAVNAGVTLVKSLSLDQIKGGFSEYETKIGSVQTILANTARYGTKLPEVTASLQELNTYADKTIYNFGDMTKNIGLFTNAGIKIKDATSMIKGFSNVAAASGTTSEGAASSAYQLSQALSAGKITLMDWRSLTNVGMGNKNMQQGIIDIANSMGTLDKAGLKAGDVQKNFNGTLEKGWLTADVMSNYLKIMAGDMTDAQQKSLGLSKTQIAGFKTQQKTAEDAATKVRTLTALIGTVKESIGSSWATTFETLLGDFNSATTLFTNANNVLGKMFGASGDARNKLLKDYVKLGGRDLAIDGITQTFKALFSILKPIKEAFREIFPKSTAKDLFAMTKAFRDFMKGLILGPETAAKVKRAFAGLFAIFSIAEHVVMSVVHVFTDLFVMFDGGGTKILDFAAKIGDWLVALDKSLKKGNDFTVFMGKLPTKIIAVVDKIKEMASKFKTLFDGFKQSKDVTDTLDRVKNLAKGITNLFKGAKDSDKMATSLGTVKDAIGQFDAAVTKSKSVLSTYKDVFKRIGDLFQPLTDAIATGAKNFWAQAKEVFTSGDPEEIMSFLQTGFLGAIALMIRNFFKKGSLFDFNLGDTLEGITGAFKSFSGVMTGVQQNLKAGALMKIAIAIGVLVASLVVLSFIDPDKLKTAMQGVATAMALLVGAMVTLDHATAGKGYLKMPVIAAGMILMAGAVGLLVLSVKALAKLDWESLKKGLTAVGALLAMLVAASAGLSASSSGILRSGAAMLLLAAAIKIMASALTDLSGLSWEELRKGLAGLAGGLTAMVAAMNLMPTSGMVKAGLGMIGLGIAINLLVKPIQAFSKMSWQQIAKGLTTLGGALVGIAASMQLMPKSMLLQAASILILSTALGTIGKAVQNMGGMSWEVIGKGLATMGASLGILVVGLNLMNGTITGSAAMVVATVALAKLYPVLVNMASMSWGDLAKGLAAIAASLLIFAGGLTIMSGTIAGSAALVVAAAALALLAPVLKGLGAMKWSDLAIGLAAIAAVLGILGVAGLLMAPVTPILLALGVAMLAMGGAAALAGIGAAALATALPPLVKAGTDGIKLLITTIKEFIKLLPSIAKNFALAIVAFLTVLGQNGPKIVVAFGKILGSLLTAVTQNIPKVAALFSQLISSALRVIRDASPQVVSTAVKVISDFLSGITQVVPKVVSAGINVLKSFLKGVGQNIGDIVRSVADIINGFLKALAGRLPEIVDNGAKLIVSFLQGVADAIRNNMGPMLSAVADIGKALVEGLWDAIQGLAGWLWDKVTGWMSGIWTGIKNFFGIHSPSKQMFWIGEMLIQGLANAMKDKNDVGAKAAVGFGRGVHDALQDSLSNIPNLLNDVPVYEPVIKPVLDLSGVQAQTKTISSLLTPKLNTSVTAALGNSANVGYNADKPVAAAPVVAVPAPVTFEQNIYAPTALSTAEIYANTKGQIARAKGGLLNA